MITQGKWQIRREYKAARHPLEEVVGTGVPASTHPVLENEVDIVVYDDDPDEVPWVVGVAIAGLPGGISTVLANARVMAAAPAMLAAIGRLVAMSQQSPEVEKALEVAGIDVEILCLLDDMEEEA